MNRLDPRQKLFVAAALLVLLAVAGAWATGGAVSGARAVLVVATLAGAGLWWRRRAGRTGLAAPVSRLAIVERAGLSPRCSVALVRADGREYLIAFGDGFAQIHATEPSLAFGRSAPEVRP